MTDTMELPLLRHSCAICLHAKLSDSLARTVRSPGNCLSQQWDLKLTHDGQHWVLHAVIA